jgi:hypothetical protein
MNDPILMATKLSELVELAKNANTGYEKAAIYPAVICIENAFNDEANLFSPYIMEKVSKACHHINAIIGYDIVTGKNSSEHISWAKGEVSVLIDLLNERSKVV